MQCISTSGSHQPQDLPRPVGTLSTWLMVAEIALCSDFWLQPPQKNPLAQRHTRLLQAKLINKKYRQITIYAYHFRWLQYVYRGTLWRSCLRHYARSRKVAGSSLDEVDFFNLPNTSSRIMALGSTQPLREMSTRNIPGGKERLADNITAICEPIDKMWKASTSHNPMGLHGLLQGQLYLYLTVRTS
jgi:hypothetical protein